VGVSAMKILDKSTKKYDLVVQYHLGFGFHFRYSNGYLKQLHFDLMGLSFYLAWDCIEELND
jgi:hypothetical protein